MLIEARAGLIADLSYTRTGRCDDLSTSKDGQGNGFSGPKIVVLTDYTDQGYGLFNNLSKPGVKSLFMIKDGKITGLSRPVVLICEWMV